jgi:predicted nucleic acid-binding protein
MSGRDKFVLDTNAVLAIIKGAAIPAAMAERIRRARNFVSVITRIELFAFSGLAAQDAVASAEETKIRLFLKKCRVVPLNKKAEREAILLRRAKPKLRLPDAIIAATAVVLHATLITNDDDILRLGVPGLKVVSIG